MYMCLGLQELKSSLIFNQFYVKSTNLVSFYSRNVIIFFLKPNFIVQIQNDVRVFCRPHKLCRHYLICCYVKFSFTLFCLDLIPIY